MRKSEGMIFMKEEELKRFRDYANHYQGSDVFFLMEHIDEQAKQIAKLTEETDCTEIYESLESAGIDMGDNEQPKDIVTEIEILVSQIATLKAALLNHVIDDLGDIRLSNRMADGGYDARTDDDLEKEAKDQLAKEYPEIFAEEKE